MNLEMRVRLFCFGFLGAGIVGEVILCVEGVGEMVFEKETDRRDNDIS